MRKVEIDAILQKMLHMFPNVSGFNLSPNRPIQAEVSGQLVKVPVQPDIERLTPFQTEIFALSLIGGNRRQCKNLLDHGFCDSTYFLDGKVRFQVNIFSQRGNFSITMRKLESKIITLEELKLPEAFNKMVQEKSGLILISGGTGAGKSTSINALLHELNLTQPIHIVTLEDPIKNVHSNIKATFNQRELGSDFETFSQGLGAALRQLPQVIFVGELRDQETVDLALKAAETGRLVLSTVRTIGDAGQTINRIVSLFQQEEKKQVRQRLAETTRWIVAQRLISQDTGERIVIHDIIGNSSQTRESILMGESEGKTFYEIQESSLSSGMQTFDQALVKAFEGGLLTAENVEFYSTKAGMVKRGISRIRKTRGEDTSEITGLSIETNEPEMAE